ncbi:integrase [Phytobacter sp. AG2a]
MVTRVRNSGTKKKMRYLSLEDVDFTKPVKNISDFRFEDHNDGESAQFVVIKLPTNVNRDDFQVALMSAVNALASIKSRSVAVDERENEKGGLKRDMASELKAESINNDTSASRNAERLEKLKAAILEDSTWLSSREVSELASIHSRNTSAAPNRWKHAKRIFALPVQGKDYFPQYALDEGGQPLPVMKKIIAFFGESKTAWALAIWLGTPNSWLNNSKPKDLLLSMPGKVLKAAEEEKAGALHG